MAVFGTLPRPLYQEDSSTGGGHCRSAADGHPRRLNEHCGFDRCHCRWCNGLWRRIGQREQTVHGHTKSTLASYFQESARSISTAKYKAILVGVDQPNSSSSTVTRAPLFCRTKDDPTWWDYATYGPTLRASLFPSAKSSRRFSSTSRRWSRRCPCTRSPRLAGCSRRRRSCVCGSVPRRVHFPTKKRGRKSSHLERASPATTLEERCWDKEHENFNLLTAPLVFW